MKIADWVKFIPYSQGEIEPILQNMLEFIAMFLSLLVVLVGFSFDCEGIVGKFSRYRFQLKHFVLLVDDWTILINISRITHSIEEF